LQPAIVRVINAQGSALSLGSGTLVDKNEQHGLVLTCAHLFREGVGEIRVVLPQGGTYGAKLLELDAGADLAALLIVAPPVDPLAVATQNPQLGEPLRSCGYGSAGRLWCNRGRALRYVSLGGTEAETLELSGMARQGDSGGPVLNEQGEVVAVLFGTDGRVVDGTCCLRIRRFLGRLSTKFRKQPQLRQAPLQQAPSPQKQPPPPIIVQMPSTDSSTPPASPAADGAKTVSALEQRLEEATGRWQREQQGLGARMQELGGLKGALAHFEQRLQASEAALQPQRLRILVEDIAGKAAGSHAAGWASLVWPVVGGALGLSTPPTAVFVALRLIAWWAARRRNKAPTSPAVSSPSGSSSSLNDDYAAQLAKVFEHSGRSALQDATLGREYDEELRRASQSSDAQRSNWARLLRDKVESRFHRIHGQSPTPAEPVTASNA